MRCAHLLLIGLVCCASCAAAPAGRRPTAPACAPAGPAPTYPSGPADPASVRPELPPIGVPTRPLVPLPPTPEPARPAVPISDLPDTPAAQPEPSDPPKRPRPEPEILRVETPTPLQVEPIGKTTDSIAASLSAIAGELIERPAWPPSWPATPADATATADAAANAEATAGEAAPARTAPGPATSGPSTIVATWAQDLLYYGLTALAASAGIAVPGGVAGLAAWAGWRLVRRLVRKMAGAKPQASSLEASFPATNPQPASPAFPHLPVDYAKIWADHYEKDGGNAQHEALKCDLYREAVQLVREGKLAVLGDPVRTADAIDNWVFREFSGRVSKMVPDVNIYQRALLGFLYRQAVDAIRRGEIQVYGPAETADAIETWVRREFAARLLKQ